MKPGIDLLIKPVSAACNMDCTYCFYADEAKKREQDRNGKYSYGVMSRETAHKVIDRAYEESPSYCGFGFQGGEPTLAGLSFFQDFAAYARERRPEGTQLAFTMQTNGLELEDDFLDFLKKEQFLVGVSLDGPKGIHDRNRKLANQEGTFFQVMNTIKRMQEREIEFNVLTVLTDRSAMQIEKIYRFLCKENLLFQQYLPCLSPLEEDQSFLQPAEYAQALKKLFTIWLEDYRQGNYVYIRQFENWVGMLKGFEPEACAMKGRCGMQNVIEANADIYACDFYVLEEYRLGNLWEESLEEIRRKEAYQRFFQDTAGKRSILQETCQGCEARAICRGGCIREYENGSYRHCQAYQEFYRFAKERLYWLTGH